MTYLLDVFNILFLMMLFCKNLGHSHCNGEASCVQEVVLSKCCDVNQVFNETQNQCVPGTFNKSRLTIVEDVGCEAAEVAFETGPLQPQDCISHQMKSLEPALYPEDEYMFFSNGTMLLPKLGLWLGGGRRDYCLDEIVDRDKISVVVCTYPGMSGHDETMHFTAASNCHGDYDCLINQPDGGMYSCDTRENVYTAAILASVICLAVTLIVYYKFSELRNLPGRNLVSLCLSLFVGYLILTIVRVLGLDHMPKSVCFISATLLMFSFLSAFAWMTVNALDICLTFGRRFSCNTSLGGDPEQQRNKKSSLTIDQPPPLSLVLSGASASTTSKKWFYNSFGWGLPIMITAVAVAIDLSPLTSYDVYKPNFAMTSCWFHGRQEVVIYFFGPIGGLLVINTFLFSWTSVSLCRMEAYLLKESKTMNWRKHSEFKRTSKTIGSLQNRLKLHLKLFAIMGVSWAFEVLSWSLPTASTCWPWYFITDLANALQGVWIFLVYIAKPSIWRKMTGREDKPGSGMGMGMASTGSYPMMASPALSTLTSRMIRSLSAVTSSSTTSLPTLTGPKTPVVKKRSIVSCSSQIMIQQALRSQAELSDH